MKHAREDYNRFQDPLGLIPEDEPVMIFRGQDRFATVALDAYVDVLRSEGVAEDVADAVERQSKAMSDWHVKKVPNL